MKKLFKKRMVKGMEIDKHDDEDETHQCSICLKGKITQQPIPKVSNIENSHVLYYVYSNVYGSMQKTTQDSYHYFMTFIDSHSQYIKVKLLKTKDKAEKKLIALIECAEVETGKLFLKRWWQQILLWMICKVPEIKRDILRIHQP